MTSDPDPLETKQRSKRMSTQEADDVRTFDQVVEPLGRETFFSEYWGRQFVHIPGSRGRFNHLFPWDTLNQILENHRLDPRRIRLVKDTKNLDESLFLQNHTDWRIHPAGLYR